MPARSQSLRLTDLYRDRLRVIRERVEGLAEQRWNALMPEDLDGGVWIASMAAALTAAQIEAVRATAGYLSAFAASETGTRTPITLDSARYASEARDGRRFEEVLQSPIIGTKLALSEGKPLEDALSAGLVRAKRIVGFDTDITAQTALLETIEESDRFTGWQRAVRGTCGACLAAATGPSGGLRFPRHPHCQCLPEPRVAGVKDTVARATGAALFAAMTVSEQNEAVGEEAAELVRAGEVSLSELAARSHMETEDDWLTQRPVEQLT